MKFGRLMRKLIGKNLNLAIYFGEDLHDYPECLEDVKEYIDILKEELGHLNGDEKHKKMSLLGSYYRLIGECKEAHPYFGAAYFYFAGRNPQLEIVNMLRWADAFRFEKRFDEAQKILKQAEAVISESDNSDYHDFLEQHFGKLHFDMGNYKAALECFERAYSLRLAKGVKDLIESSDLAIRLTKHRISINS